MSFNDPYYNDGIFHDIVNVLDDEEYFSKVGFDQRLLDVFNLYENEGTYFWPINSRQGYIQRGRFRPENPEKGRLEWAIIYERCPASPDIIFINLGDLLNLIPIADRRKWKEYFRRIEPSAPQHAEKLLFFENEEELHDVMEYWMAPRTEGGERKGYSNRDYLAKFCLNVVAVIILKTFFIVMLFVGNVYL